MVVRHHESSGRRGGKGWGGETLQEGNSHALFSAIPPLYTACTGLVAAPVHIGSTASTFFRMRVEYVHEYHPVSCNCCCDDTGKTWCCQVGESPQHLLTGHSLSVGNERSARMAPLNLAHMATISEDWLIPIQNMKIKLE